MHPVEEKAGVMISNNGQCYITDTMYNYGVTSRNLNLTLSKSRIVAMYRLRLVPSTATKSKHHVYAPLTDLLLSGSDSTVYATDFIMPPLSLRMFSSLPSWPLLARVVKPMSLPWLMSFSL